MKRGRKRKDEEKEREVATMAEGSEPQEETGFVHHRSFAPNFRTLTTLNRRRKRKRKGKGRAYESKSEREGGKKDEKAGRHAGRQAGRQAGRKRKNGGRRLIYTFLSLMCSLMHACMRAGGTKAPHGRAKGKETNFVHRHSFTSKPLTLSTWKEKWRMRKEGRRAGRKGWTDKDWKEGRKRGRRKNKTRERREEKRNERKRERKRKEGGFTRNPTWQRRRAEREKDERRRGRRKGKRRKMRRKEGRKKKKRRGRRQGGTDERKAESPASFGTWKRRKVRRKGEKRNIAYRQGWRGKRGEKKEKKEWRNEEGSKVREKKRGEIRRRRMMDSNIDRLNWARKEANAEEREKREKEGRGKRGKLDKEEHSYGNLTRFCALTTSCEWMNWWEREGKKKKGTETKGGSARGLPPTSASRNEQTTFSCSSRSFLLFPVPLILFSFLFLSSYSLSFLCSRCFFP